ncbi:hypothetical protein FQN60_000471 [Etheostoma spectabile]|uniref:SH2 domain-containing protein n=1 Tax=Etheostoma spectabile TaxID=54343 RepID=A0A5J5D267_9PERO|nr:hypothetical protein FQN60_000471 [Etheostoma spectabile]
MSSDRGPSRVEVTGWSPQQLADYLKRMGLSGCDKVVIKNAISGSRFVNLSENDLQKFPKLHAPMISKISVEISKKEERRRIFKMAADVQSWPEDEFDDEECEDDYESPFSGNEDDSVEDYETPSDDPNYPDYEPPPTEPLEDLAKKLYPTLPIGDSDYIDNHLSSRGQPPAVCPRPPVATLSAPSPRMDLIATQWTSQAHILGGLMEGESSKCQMKLLNTTLYPSKIKVTSPVLDSLGPPHAKETGSLPHKLKSAIAEQRGSFVGSDRQSFHPSPATTGHTQELDPRWYVGKVTRGQAERCLKQVKKDGTYLVRDSTRQLASQPFTLMVFYQDKVYNIQIRQQNQNFQLGTGLKAQESFPSVSGIIGHYSQSPLLLIDANNRSSSQQNQCLLSDPAGYHMTEEKWS